MSDYDAAFSAAFGKGAKQSASPYDDVARASLAQALQPALEYSNETGSAPVQDFKGNLKIGPFDTGIPLPESVNKKLAQIGSGIADLGYAFSPPDQVDEKRKIDAKLMDSGAAKGARFFGKALPFMALPQVGGPIIGGMGIGGAMGAIEPVGTGESRLSNIVTSTALGGVVPGAVGAARWAARPDQARQALAQSALDQGIHIGVADMTNNGLIKGARSVLNDIPFVGAIGARQNAAKQTGFNSSVAKTMGADATSLTPDVMSSTKNRIGGELNKVWDNNNLKIDGQYIQDLQRIQQEAASKLNPEQAGTVDKHIQNLLAKSNNAEISGGFANNWQSELRMAADGEKGLAQKILSDLRKTTLDAFNRGVAPADAAALTNAKRQYGAFKTVEPLMNSAEAGVAGRAVGDVPAALLPQRVVQQYGSSARSPFGDLPQIGSQFIVDRTPKTGGSARAAIQNTIVGAGLMGGGGAGAGAVLAGGAGALAGGGIGMGLSALLEHSLGSPSLARSVLAPKVQRGLLDNPELSQTVLELLRNSANRLPVAAGMGLLSASPLE